MFNWILENVYVCTALTLILFMLMVYAYLAIDCDIAEAIERRKRQRRHKKIDLTKLVVTKKKNSGNGPELM